LIIPGKNVVRKESWMFWGKEARKVGPLQQVGGAPQEKSGKRLGGSEKEGVPSSPEEKDGDPERGRRGGSKKRSGGNGT